MSAEQKVVLVTGAGGFIGGRVVEVLLQEPGLEPRPAVRRWSTLARIGRHPLEAVQCDLLEPDQVERAVQGVDSIVHCAVGSREVTVEGTRNLLRAAGEAGVRRIVHLSTMDVYGRLEGTLHEELAPVPTGRSYGDSKIEAEEVCRHHAEEGLDVLILRPTIVYGPFSDLWTTAFSRRLVDGNWLLPREACQGTCNLVHVDDLVRAILLALEAPSGLSGRAYNVNGPDRPTWQEYVDLLNESLGLPPLDPPAPRSSRLRSFVVEPVRSGVKFVFHRLQDPIVALYKGSRVARVVMKKVESTLRRVPAAAEYDLYGREASVPTDRAEADLGFEPQISMEVGVPESAAWLRHMGISRTS